MKRALVAVALAAASACAAPQRAADAPEGSLVTRSVEVERGQAIALQTLLIAMLRSMPMDQRLLALRQFDTDRDAARTALVKSNASDAVLKAFDQQVADIEKLRTELLTARPWEQ
jgi:hypothetical protein